jgi:Ran GTPase-activating protein (RanGAP) involved in mRNA processing and transport
MTRNESELLLEAIRCHPSLTALELDAKGVEGARFAGEVMMMNDCELRILRARWNSFGDSGAPFIADALAKNTSLTELDLVGDQLGGVGAAAIAAALAGGVGSAQTLSPNIGAAGLVTLSLANNTLGPVGASALAAALETNTSLTRIDLATCVVGTGGAEALGRALRVNKTLAFLGLKQNGLGDREMATLAVGLADNSTLTSLELSDNCFGCDGLRLICEAVCSNSTSALARLELGNNSLAGCSPASSAAAAQALRNALLSRHSPLTHLGFTTNRGFFGGGGGDDDSGSDAITPVAVIGEALAVVGSNLQSLDLSSCGVDHEGARALGAGLAVNRSLTTLQLGWDNLQSDGIACLADALRDNATLVTLALIDCNLGPVGAASIAAALGVPQVSTNSNRHGSPSSSSSSYSSSSSLTNLGLGMNYIDDEGASAIAELLQSMAAKKFAPAPTDPGVAQVARAWLVKLDLCMNSIGPAGMKHLGTALTVNRSLRSLNLDSNDAGDDGAAAIAAALKVNESLESLNLGANDISETGLAAIVEAMDENRSLLTFILHDNNFDSADEVVGAMTRKTMVPVPLTPFQRLAFLKGHFRAGCRISRVPLDIVRRILTCFRVCQGERQVISDGQGGIDGFRTRILGGNY